jgi:hypothetical protein
MPKPILPDHVREKISTMIDAGLPVIDIYEDFYANA